MGDPTAYAMSMGRQDREGYEQSPYSETAWAGPSTHPHTLWSWMHCFVSCPHLKMIMVTTFSRSQSWNEDQMWSIHGENLEQCLAHRKDSIHVSWNLVYSLWAVTLQVLAGDCPPSAMVPM